MTELLDDNKKLITEFGAKPISEIKGIIPDFYTFNKGLIYSHRDFDKFMLALKSGKKCAIVSGFNASGTLHFGHKAVFDTILYFQKEYNIPVFIPISDDESYLANKISTQEEALKNAYIIAQELIAYGFNSKNTYFIIDQIYTNIYNLAIKLSKKVTLSEIKSTYGYEMSNNPGLFFYPAIQSAHVLFPMTIGFDNVLVPIGPDEDSHLRIARDIASKMNLNCPSVIHLRFLPGIDGDKMSKSQKNTINLNESEEQIKKKISSSYSGGGNTLEEHKKYGGNPDIDIPCIYLSNFFLSENESSELFKDYKSGKISSGDVKKRLTNYLTNFITNYKKSLTTVNSALINASILKNNYDINNLFSDKNQFINYFNGQFCRYFDCITITTDLSILRGYGVFEYIRTYNGEIKNIDKYIERLKISISNLKMPYLIDYNDLKEVIFKLIKLNYEKQDLTLRILILGGKSNSIDLLKPSEDFNLIILMDKLHPIDKRNYDRGISLKTINDHRWFSDTKSTNYISAIVALNSNPTYNDILFTKENNILECSTSNIFIIKNEEIYTPKENILFGITRNMLINKIKNKYTVEEKIISIQELYDADEIFISATTKGIIPVTNIDGKIISNGCCGKITKKLQQEFNEMLLC